MLVGFSYVVWLADAKFSYLSRTFSGNDYEPLLRGPIRGKGNSSNFKTEWDRGVWVPGVFKLDHLQPFAPLTFWNFSNFFTFILERPVLITPGTNNGKREFFQLQNWKRQGVLSAWGIQTGPIASLWANSVQIFSQLFHFHTGEPFLITLEDQ